MNDNYESYSGLSNFDVLFSPDGRVLITFSNNSISFWDTQKGKLLGEVTPNYEFRYANNIVFSPDGRLIAVTGADGLIRIWGVPVE